MTAFKAATEDSKATTAGTLASAQTTMVISIPFVVSLDIFDTFVFKREFFESF